MKRNLKVNGKTYETEKIITHEIRPHSGEYIEIEVSKGTVEEVVLFENKEESKSNFIRDVKLFSTHLNIINEISYIPLELVNDTPEEWRFFPEYNLEERCNLKKSICDNGLLSPIILWENTNNTYVLLCGRERFLAYQELLEELEGGESSLYEKIPAFVIPHDKINDLVARDIIIDENICRRTLSTKTRALVAVKKYGIMQKLKKRKNEINISKTLARTLDVTPQTIFGYLKLMNLIPEIMALLQNNKISLKSAKKLAQYSKETQIELYNSLGKEHLKNFKIDIINISDEKRPNLVQKIVEIVKNYSKPYWSNINLKFPTKYVDAVIETLETFQNKRRDINFKFKRKNVSLQ